MSYANAATAIINTIEALSPTTKTRSRDSFRHINSTLEGAAEDRLFKVRPTTLSQRYGHVSTNTPRYISSVTIEVLYLATRNQNEDYKRIEEDVIQIGNAMTELGNHHSSVFAVIAGDTFWQSTVEELFASEGFILTMTFELHHS